MATKMRLIDASKAIKVLRETKVKETGAFSRGINKGLNIALSALGNQEITPTVDAVEVVHGRWIKRGNEKECSACKFIYYSNHDDFNFCPNCGAKMGGERRNNG